MQNTKKATFVAATAAVVVACSVVSIIATRGGFPVIAANQTNEYGCVSGCTGEYYPSHLKELLASNPSLNGSKNVRIKCEYVKDVYFKDVGATVTTQVSSDNNALALDVTFTWWNEKDVDLRSLIQEGDTVCLFGTVSYEIYGVRRLVVRDPIIYGVNDKVDTSLLPPVNYLQ